MGLGLKIEVQPKITAHLVTCPSIRGVQLQLEFVTFFAPHLGEPSGLLEVVSIVNGAGVGNRARGTRVILRLVSGQPHLQLAGRQKRILIVTTIDEFDHMRLETLTVFCLSKDFQNLHPHIVSVRVVVQHTQQQADCLGIASVGNIDVCLGNDVTAGGRLIIDTAVLMLDSLDPLDLLTHLKALCIQTRLVVFMFCGLECQHRVLALIFAITLLALGGFGHSRYFGLVTRVHSFASSIVFVLILAPPRHDQPTDQGQHQNTRSTPHGSSGLPPGFLLRGSALVLAQVAGCLLQLLTGLRQLGLQLGNLLVLHLDLTVSDL